MNIKSSNFENLYLKKFSRGFIFAHLPAARNYRIKFLAFWCLCANTRENLYDNYAQQGGVRKFSKYRFSKFDDLMFIFLTIYDAFYTLWVGVRENKSARKLSKFKVRENTSAR